MIKTIKKEIRDLQNQLQNHSIYQNINSIERLHCFMELHVYSVWDFMSLVKFLQNEFAPSQTPWRPLPNQKIIHFINDIVLEEESDTTPDGTHMSHFEMYCLAMEEIGAQSKSAFEFAQTATLKTLEQDANKFNIPTEILTGLNQTFAFLNSEKPHIAAAAFCFGRENIIPVMFEQLLSQIGVGEKQAPLFHYYLSRHVQLDGEVHGPMALEMIEILCGDDQKKWDEVIQAAKTALKARIYLWNYIESQLPELHITNNMNSTLESTKSSNI